MKPSRALPIPLLLCLYPLFIHCGGEEGEGPPGEDGFGCTESLDSAPLFDEALCLSAFPEKGESEEESEYLDYQCSLMTGLGVSMVRTDFSWIEIEPFDEEFEFSPYDRMVQGVLGKGLLLLPILDYGNPWATEETGDDPAYPPDDPADFGDFAEEVASRYTGIIDYFEIWNEENVGWIFWKEEEDPSEYGYLLKEAFLGVKRGNPDAAILLGGLFYPDLFVTGAIPYLEELYREHPDIANYYDILAIHPYRYPFTPPETGDEEQEPLVTSLCRLKEFLEEEGSSKPIWITEMGWHTATSQPIYEGVTEEEQGAFLIRAFNIALSQGVERFCVYTLFDGEDFEFYQEDAFGLYHFDDDPWSGERAVPKVSSIAIQTMKEALSGTRMTSLLHYGDGFEGGDYGFIWTEEGGGRGVNVLWTTEGARSVEIDISGPVKGVEWWSMTGDRAGLAAEGGKVVVEVSEEPCYVIEYL